MDNWGKFYNEFDKHPLWHAQQSEHELRLPRELIDLSGEHCAWRLVAQEYRCWNDSEFGYRKC